MEIDGPRLILEATRLEKYESRHQSLKYIYSQDEEPYAEKLRSFVRRSLASSRDAKDSSQEARSKRLLILKPQALCELMKDIESDMKNNISKETLEFKINTLVKVLTHCDITFCDYQTIFFRSKKVHQFPAVAEKLCDKYLDTYKNYKGVLAILKQSLVNLHNSNPF
jgi:hypothetical protein